MKNNKKPNTELTEQRPNTIKRLKFVDYIFILLVTGLLFSCLLIMIFEIGWDSVWKHLFGPDKTLTREIIESFFRAALIEETFKFLGFLIAYKSRKINHQAMAMWAFGCIGLMYGLFEKVALFNVFAVIVGLIFPMHILWGLNSGRHFQAFIEAKKEGNKKKAFLHFLMFTVVVFLFHGCWDAFISLAGAFSEDPKYEVISVIGFAFIIIFGIAYMVLTIVKTVKTTKKIHKDIKKEKELSETVAYETNEKDIQQ